MEKVQQWEALKLEEAAGKTGKTENDLLRMGARGELPLWCWVSEKSPFTGNPGEIFHGWARLLPTALGALLLPRGERGIFTPYLLTPDGREIRSKNPLIVVKRIFLRVMPADLERLTLAVPKKQKPPIRKPGVKCRLTVALENARATLIGEGKKEPSTDDVIDFLKLDDPIGAVVGYGKDKNGLYLEWEDKSGKHHTTHKKRIANKLSEIRNENGWLS